jgi:hypothetical protein
MTVVRMTEMTQVVRSVLTYSTICPHPHRVGSHAISKAGRLERVVPQFVVLGVLQWDEVLVENLRLPSKRQVINVLKLGPLEQILERGEGCAEGIVD